LWYNINGLSLVLCLLQLLPYRYFSYCQEVKKAILVTSVTFSGRA